MNFYDIWYCVDIMTRLPLEKCQQSDDLWIPLSLSELSPIIFYMELTHLVSSASICGLTWFLFKSEISSFLKLLQIKYNEFHIYRRLPDISYNTSSKIISTKLLFKIIFSKLFNLFKYKIFLKSINEVEPGNVIIIIYCHIVIVCDCLIL